MSAQNIEFNLKEKILQVTETEVAALKQVLNTGTEKISGLYESTKELAKEKISQVKESEFAGLKQDFRRDCAI